MGQMGQMGQMGGVEMSGRKAEDEAQKTGPSWIGALSTAGLAARSEVWRNDDHWELRLSTGVSFNKANVTFPVRRSPSENVSFSFSASARYLAKKGGNPPTGHPPTHGVRTAEEDTPYGRLLEDLCCPLAYEGETAGSDFDIWHRGPQEAHLREFTEAGLGRVKLLACGCSHSIVVTEFRASITVVGGDTLSFYFTRRAGRAGAGNR
ncbi:hypothetical protein EYF80_022792 [Liparis tanakae]|uniref:Uncharacterized protein n=1 Tax=Liparis tanakae TaxID=230148 RepID=A0A4Z2HMA9_9TELE|nr:hypothetical protein EYF80_022792 [Liparis tanakae]